MKIRNFFSVLIFLLLVGTHFPLCAAVVPSVRWNFTGSESPFPGWPFPDFEIWGVPGSPAVDDDGHIYVGSLNGYFFALHPNGDLKWVNADLEGTFAYTPAIGDNGIIYASNGNGLFAFDPDDGEVLWSYYAPCLFLGAPAIARDGTVYIGSNSDRLFAFTPMLGKKWEYQGVTRASELEFGIYADPVIGVDGTVYCIQSIVQSNSSGGTTTVGGGLHSITPDGQPGPLGWVTESLVTISPAVTGNRIYVTGRGGELYAFSLPHDNMWNWSHSVGWAQPSAGPVIGADGTIYACIWDGLYALHPTDGSEQWVAQSPNNLLFKTPAIGADGIIYAGTYGNIGDGGAAAFVPVGEVCALYPSGSIAWSLHMEGQVHSSPAIVNLGEKSDNQGALYIGRRDSLLALNVDSPGLAQSPWPMDRANLKRNARSGDSMIRMLWNLHEMVKKLNFSINIANSLACKVTAAVQSLEKEKVNPAKNQVEAFINEVRALKSKIITAQDADRLINSAQRIIDFL